MGGFSIWHWLVVGLVILLLFGKGRFSDMMGDVAKGLKSFKKGISEDDEAATTTQQQQPRLAQPTGLDQQTGTPIVTPAAPVVHPAPDVTGADRPAEPR